MRPVSILTETDLRTLVPLDGEAIACVEAAFRALEEAEVVMPPVLRLDIPAHRGEVDVKTAYVPGLAEFTIKISPGFFDNPALGLPSTGGLMVVLDARTGQVRRLLLDNGYLTDIRTAAAGAVAAKHLARADAAIATIMGAGMQARLQFEALMLVRPIRQGRVWARRYERAVALAAALESKFGIPVVPHDDPAEAVRGADIVVTTTPSTEPILRAGWIEPGQHITAMGSDAEHKNEIEPRLLGKVDLYVADSLAQTRRIGELHHARATGAIGPDDAEAHVELGAVVAGYAAGRASDAMVTLCDLTGTGVQDTAIANLAGRRADDGGIGLSFDTRRAAGADGSTLQASSRRMAE